MNLRKYIREQISESILKEGVKTLINKEALRKAVEQYIDENPKTDLSYANELGMMAQNSSQILNAITGNSSRFYLEKIANIIGRDISEFEYETGSNEKSNFNPKKSDINPNLYGSLDENMKNKMQNFADSRTGIVSYEDLQDISNENDMDLDSDEFLNIYSYTSDEVADNFKQELLQDLEWVRDEYFDGEYPNTFEEFYNEFKKQHFDNYYSKEEVKDKFEELTTNPNQLTLFEAKMPSEDFIKVIFEYEFPSNENRLELINIIKDYFGEPLGKRQGDDYWSTYIPKLELNDFLFSTQDFNPYATKEIIQANRFKPLTKELKDGDIIKFFDYTVSENDPPRAEGYLKPGFIQRNRSLMKWNGDSKEAWIDNSMIDKYYFYHGDVSDIKDHPGSRKVDSDYVKIFFDDAMFNNMNAEKEDELRKIITAHKGQLRYVFGKDRASGGQRYTLVPKDLSDDFIQAAYDFGAYEAETERNIYLEDKALNEIRKIVRGVINKVIK